MYFKWLAIIFPNVLAKIDNIMKIMLNPRTKPNAFINVLFFFSSSFPAKYDIYIGNIGSTHGDIKLAIPSMNVIK